MGLQESNPDTTHTEDGRLPAAGSAEITIAGDHDTRWSVTAQYATVSTKP
jgi:hypothetical protein